MPTQIAASSQKTVPLDATFSDLPPALADVLEQEAVTTSYPTGAVLFSEGQTARGVFVVRRGRARLTMYGRDGRTLILRIVGPGFALGIASVVSARQYEATATAQEPCEISFLRQADFLRHVRLNGELAFWVTQHISQDYASTCREIRDLILTDSARERFARLLVGWLDQNSNAKNPTQVKMVLTHEEIGQMIGTSRETVSRLFAGFKKLRLIQQNGCTIVVPNRMALESLIAV